MQNISTCLWYESQAKEAAEFYVSLFPNSKILEVGYYPEEVFRPKGSVLIVRFTLDGVEHHALNGGPHFKLSPAASLMAFCETQAEVDRLWDAFCADGGEPSQCGWLTDKFGLSWQIVPRPVIEMLNASDRESAHRAFSAVMTMVKIDIATVQKAFAAA